MLFALATSLLATASLVGKPVPAGLTLDHSFPPEKVDLSTRLANKKVILLGLPGAFTPT